MIVCSMFNRILLFLCDWLIPPLQQVARASHPRSKMCSKIFPRRSKLLNRNQRKEGMLRFSRLFTSNLSDYLNKTFISFCETFFFVGRFRILFRHKSNAFTQRIKLQQILTVLINYPNLAISFFKKWVKIRNFSQNFKNK